MGKLDMAAFQDYVPCVTQYALCIMRHPRYVTMQC